MIPGRVHELRLIQPYFDLMWSKQKLFSYRINDRDFQVGDKVLLRHYDEATDNYPGRSIEAEITYILENAMTIPDGYCILQLSDLQNMISEDMIRKGEQEERRLIFGELSS